MAQHAKPSAPAADLRWKFDAMLVALTAHEHQHGMLAAQEIMQCATLN